MQNLTQKMKFSLWTQYSALNSKPVFDAFRSGANLLGYDCVDNDPSADVDVIWSVLWHGRMAQNKTIWERALAQSKPVVVLEVGGIQRGTTWKVGINGINRSAYFGPGGNSSDRRISLGLELTPWKTNNTGSILICTQHDKSEQWRDMPSVSDWVAETINKIRKHTDRHIIVRTHPRCNIQFADKKYHNVNLQTPRKIPGTYDDFDYTFENAWAVVNWSSNPAVQAVIKGIPVFVGPSSLAYDVGNHNFDTINNPLKPDREQWLNDYAHTEYTVDEIAQGVPLKHLTIQFS